MITDAQRYQWLKECTVEQFEYLSKNWRGLDDAIDELMAIERTGEYAQPPKGWQDQ